MNSRSLNKSDIKDLNNKLLSDYGIKPFSKKDRVVLVEDEISYIEINGNIDYFYYEEKLLPTLKNLLRENFLKKITVDMGAVKFIVSGADIMRPGVVEMEDGICKDDVVSVVDEKNGKVLAIGTTLFGTEDMNKLEAGKCIKNIHFVGDKVWQLN